MSKRKRVPHELYSELTEYSSLLRALRTTNTLDVASQLTNTAHPFAASYSDEDEDWDDDDDVDQLLTEEDEDNAIPRLRSARWGSSPPTASSQPVPGPSNLSRPASPSSRPSVTSKPTTSTKQRGKLRKTWTRWPLMAEDLLTPEWSLQDEVAIIAKQTLQHHPTPPMPNFTTEDIHSSAEKDMLDEDDDITGTDADPPRYLMHLYHSTSQQLERVLALLAAHSPARTKSLQNRIEPMKWQSVIDILSNCCDPAVVNEKILKNIITRMEAIYGPYSPENAESFEETTLPIHRIQSSISAKQELADAFQKVETDLFTISIPLPPKADTASSDEAQTPDAGSSGLKRRRRSKKGEVSEHPRVGSERSKKQIKRPRLGSKKKNER